MIKIVNLQTNEIIYKTTKEQEIKNIKKLALQIGLGLASFKLLTMLASKFWGMFLVSKGLFDENIETNFEGFEPTTYYLLTIFITFVSLGLPLIILLKFSQEKPRDLIKFKVNDLTLPLIGLGLGGCVIANLVANSISSIMEQFGYPMSGGEVYYNGEILIAILMVIANCLFPAVFEELLFRGFILGNLKKYGEFPALLISSFTFALMHGTFLQLPFALMSGLVLGFIYLKSNSIVPSMIVHFFNNSLSAITIIVSTHWGEPESNLCYSLLLVFIIFIWFIALNNLKQKNIFNFNYSKDQRIRMGLFFKKYVFSIGSFVLLICIAYNIIQILTQ